MSNANEFFNRIVEGTDYSKEITLVHSSGHELEGVTMSPVDKEDLGDSVEGLPESMFEVAQEADSVEEAEDQLDDMGENISAIKGDSIRAFKNLITESLSHDNLTNTQMGQIVDELDFEPLFELGGEILELSFENAGDIKDFHVQGQD